MDLLKLYGFFATAGCISTPICYNKPGDIMNKHIEDLKLLSVLQCVSSPVKEYIDRPSHALVFRRTGAIEYNFGGRYMPLEAGQIIFLPKGSSFTTRQTTPGISRYTVVNFMGDLSLTAPKKVSIAGDLTELYTRLDLCCTLDPKKDRFALLSHFYWLLSQLFEETKAPYHSTATLSLLDPAVAHLQTHLFDPNLKIDALPKLCGISGTYFRTLFAARFGCAPKKYILDRRLTHAQQLLSSGECSRVADAARLSGFEDALYFSRVFKNRYGHAPSQR